MKEQTPGRALEIAAGLTSRRSASSAAVSVRSSAPMRTNRTRPAIRGKPQSASSREMCSM